MPSPTQQWGAEQEAVAERWLERRGYRIVRRNWRCSGAEVDRIAWFGEFLVFIEIRSRVGGTLERAFETVDRAKRRRLVQAARIYLMPFAPGRLPMVRFDIVAIVWSSRMDNAPLIGIVENAFDGSASASL